MRLIEPTKEYEWGIRAYRKEFLNAGDPMDGTGALRKMDDPLEWIQHSKRCKDPGTVPSGLVPATQYLFVREDDHKIIGMIQIRHYLNPYLEQFGGHIGYSVAPSERRKGYAAQMLKMALLQCKKLGIDNVLITCTSENEGSKRAILKNGGIYESTVYEPDEKVKLERYWVRLTD